MLKPLERGDLRWRGKWTSPLIQHPRGAARAVRGDGDLVGTGEEWDLLRRGDWSMWRT